MENKKRFQRIYFVQTSPSDPRHFVHPQVVVEVDCGKSVHQRVVDELQVLALPQVEEVLGEEHVEDGGEKHVDDHEDHQWIEEARTPEEGKQLEREKPGNYLRDKKCFPSKLMFGSE